MGNRLKELYQEKINNTTTPKQRKFIKELFKTLEPTEAAFRVYNCKNRRIASVIASQNLIKLNIELIELMEIMGLTAERDVEDLKKLREAEHMGKPDNNVRHKALELTMKLKKKLIQQPLIDQSQHIHYVSILREIAKKENDESTRTNNRGSLNIIK